VHETESLTDALSELDVLYMTRVQRERFADPVEYERLRNVYVLDKPKMALARPDMLVLHPLPRTGEIAVEVDDDPRALYFEQTVYGLYARMALILRLLETPASVVIPIPSAGQAVRCANPLCITAKEPYVPAWFEDGHCAYCEEAAPGGAAT
ncbi:MAG: aspartate carbamoyltransferase, partial [Oscillospiraceae bacterium]|nr:aspartate carbamoyltransferase [Oscillospiraceae bacterium]